MKNYKIQTEQLSRENGLLLTSTKLLLDLRKQLKMGKECSRPEELAKVVGGCYRKVSDHLVMIKKSSKKN